MAFDLRAILRLDDKFSDPMRKVAKQTAAAEKAMKALNNSTDKSSKSTDKAGKSLKGLGSGAVSASKEFGSLARSLAGVAAGYLSIQAAQKAFQSTVGEAMKYEVSSVTIDAMFNDKKLGKQYRDMVEKIAIDSPILESQQLLGSSRGFITKSKDLKQLQKMVKITEKLAAYDPIQGTEGSAFALNEFMSGDAVSLQERFELSRTDLKPIKDIFADGDIAKGLEEFDKYLEKIGISNKLINDMGNTASGKLAQVKEQFALILRDMGQPSLDVVGGFMTKILTKLENGELDRFKNVGARWIENILTGLTDGIIRVYEWFSALTQSEEWKKATTLSAKINLVIDKLSEKFTKWYEQDGGKKDLESMAKTLTTGLSAFLIDNAPTIASAALKVGSAIGTSMKEGMMASFKENNPFLYYLTQWVDDPWVSTFGGLDKNRSDGGTYQAPDWYKSLEEAGKSHAGGLDYVPYDGYKATLHKGEKVLTRGEARDNRNGNGGGGTFNFSVVMNGTGSTQQDAEQLFELFVKKVEAAGGAGA